MVEFAPITLSDAALVFIAFLWLVNTTMLASLARGLRRERAARAGMYDALRRELASQAPAKAAVAALLMASRERRATLQDVERELHDLMDQWYEVERLTERVAVRMAEAEAKGSQTRG